jgi:PhzF family phenazine biosynthesis protein
MTADVLRYTAFATDPAGGNPAGIVLDASGLSEAEMLGIAASVGYSETAFLTPGPEGGERSFTVRYFSPKAEVSFCGHATVATAVALGERMGAGEFVFHAPVGAVPVSVADEGGVLSATLISVEPRVYEVGSADVAEALAALGWKDDELDAALPPRIAYAGARHLVLGAATRERLAELDYDFERLLGLMRRLDVTTLQLVWRESAGVFHARDPFPVGGVVEDPATGAAAAAFGAYARELGIVPVGGELTIHQGVDMGRPGLLRVSLREGRAGVAVSGAAVAI